MPRAASKRSVMRAAALAIVGGAATAAAAACGGAGCSTENPAAVSAASARHGRRGSTLRDTLRGMKVIGDEDSRTVVQDPTVLPYSAVGQLFFKSAEADSLSLCTGTLISPDFVLTAAHCLIDEETREFNSDFLFVPGRYLTQDAETGALEVHEPFGRYAADAYNTLEDGGFDGAYEGDMAVLRLLPREEDGAVAGDVAGYLPVAVTCEPPTVQVVGYPSDLGAVTDSDGDGALQAYYTMITSGECTAQLEECGADLAGYTCDTEGGNSGGPVMGADGTVYAVHLGGSVGVNYANWITQDKYDNFIAQYVV